MSSTGPAASHSALTRLRAALELMRPANIVTAFADILAGSAAAGVTVLLAGGENFAAGGLHADLARLLAATFGLYGGGVVLNDVFDAALDAKERPERPIPGGRISGTSAAVLGGGLLAAGTAAAFSVNPAAGLLAAAIAACALAYDARAKHSIFWGPLFMGFCRGGNLMLGVAAVPSMLPQMWPLALIPVAYIGSVTLISRGEVSGGGRRSGIAALVTVSLIALTLPVLAVLPEYRLLPALPFAVLFAAAVLPPFLQAARTPGAQTIRKAVKRGVLSLVILNSALAAGFGGWVFGLAVLLLLPLSALLARIFPVT